MDEVLITTTKRLDRLVNEDKWFKKALALLLISLVAIVVLFYVYWNELSTLVSNLNAVQLRLLELGFCTIKVVFGIYTSVMLAQMHCERDYKSNMNQIELKRFKQSVNFFNIFLAFATTCVLIALVIIAYSMNGNIKCIQFY